MALPSYEELVGEQTLPSYEELTTPTSEPATIRSEGQGPEPRETVIEKMKAMFAGARPATTEEYGKQVAPVPPEVIERLSQPTPPEETGIMHEIEKPIRAGVEWVGEQVPQTQEAWLQAAGIPTDWTDPKQVAGLLYPQARFAMGVPEHIQQRTAAIQAAEQTPPWSQERWIAAGKPFLDIAGIAAGEFGAPEARGALPTKINALREAQLKAAVKGPEPVMPAETARVAPAVEPTTGEPYASEITEATRVPSPQVRPGVAEETPLRQPGETTPIRGEEEAIPGGGAAPEAEAEVAPLVKVKHGEHAKPGYTAVPTEDLPYAGGELPITPPVSEAVPGVPQKPSKIGKSIEAKAVEAKLTQGFAETAGYDPITIADQAQRADSVIKASPVQARAMIRGEAPLPEGLRGTSLITAMEEHLLKHPNAQVAYEMANSPLTSATSAAAQEMRLMSERVPDSITAKFAEIKAARAEGAKLRGETSAKIAKEITKEVVRTASKRPTWEAWVREIAC